MDRVKATVWLEEQRAIERDQSELGELGPGAPRAAKELQVWGRVHRQAHALRNGLAADLHKDAAYVAQYSEDAESGLRRWILWIHEAAAAGAFTSQQYRALEHLIEVVSPQIASFPPTPPPKVRETERVVHRDVNRDISRVVETLVYEGEDRTAVLKGWTA